VTMRSAGMPGSRRIPMAGPPREIIITRTLPGLDGYYLATTDR
jgi:hypothetical protein